MTATEFCENNPSIPHIYLQMVVKHLKDQLVELQGVKDALAVSRNQEDTLRNQVLIHPLGSFPSGNLWCYSSRVAVFLKALYKLVMCPGGHLLLLCVCS